MKILILHGVDSVATVRRTSLHHAFFLPRHEPGHEYWLQAAWEPIPPGVKRERFDAIVIDTTFLCWRWNKPARNYFEPLKRKYDFVRTSDAVKIAFPQDEYDHSALLDDWLASWNVDVVYSVCHDDRAEFYPRTMQRAEIRRGFTGLFEPSDIALVAKHATPWRSRGVDVGYRARRLPPWFGWFGALKSDIADRFVAAAQGRGITMDISCRLEDSFIGDEWLKFLGRCKYILGCESGSSVLDPVGKVRECCEAHLLAHPDASFDEVKQSCFPGQDRPKPFKAISPRLFEAASAGCAQILVPGDYSGLLQPWTHYIPLEADASNIDEVVAALKDEDRVEQMIRASQVALLENPELSYAAYAKDVLGAIAARRPGAAAAEETDPLDGMLRLALLTSARWKEAMPGNTPRGRLVGGVTRTVAKTEAALWRARHVGLRFLDLASASWTARNLSPFRQAWGRYTSRRGEAEAR